MMIDYNKQEVKEFLTDAQIAELLEEWGGEPQLSSFGIIAKTICHNHPQDGPSNKLYYYNNSKLFKCYSGCADDIFDIFQLYIKVKDIQEHKTVDFNAAVRIIADRFGYQGKTVIVDENALEDWEYFDNYSRIQEIEESSANEEVILKPYDSSILNNFNYKVKIMPWLNDHISLETMHKARIGYYAGGQQITIPHFDQYNRFIGLRGRSLVKDDAEVYGKYRPIRVNGQQYSHPLGFNLYGLNWAKPQLRTFKKVIVFESEKSVLQFASYFGWENNISVAVCGSSLSNYQMSLLLSSGIEEIVIGFDKQFKELNTEESLLWHKKLLKIKEKYKNNILISFLWDTTGLLGYKDSPTDKGKDVFMELFERRIV